MDHPRVLVPLLLLVDSWHYVFARLLLPHLSPSASGFFVMAVATLEVLAVNRGRVPLGVLRRHAVFFASIGFLIAASTNLGFHAMNFVDPGTASLLSRMSVPLGLALSLAWLGERMTRLEIMGALVAAAGVLVVSFQPGDYLRLGSLMVLSGTFMYSLHAALVKRYAGRIDFLDFFLFRLLGTTLFLLILTVGQGALAWPGATGWGLVVATATVDVVISRALYYLALRRLEMSFHTVLLTLTPVATMGWSALLFASRPSLQEAVGGGAVLAGVALVTASKAGLLGARRV